MAKAVHEHKTHAPSRLGMWLNRLPEGKKWLYPVYASRQLQLAAGEICSPRLPREMDGLKVAYLSDIHYGSFFNLARARALVESVNALAADVVILGGDYGEDGRSSTEFFAHAPPFQAKIAVCGVLGNHDCPGRDDVLWAMQQAGVTPLVNSALTLRVGEKRLTICAVDDICHGFPDFPGAAKQAEGADYVIFAPHAPDAVYDALACAKEPFFDLMLCGHTHGGQVTLFGFAPYTASRYGMLRGNRYLSGLYALGRAQLMVSNGVGVTWMPLRVCAPAQYHLLTLRRTREK